MAFLPLLLSIAATTVPALPPHSRIALARSTARIVSGASVDTDGGVKADAPRTALRETVDPANGQPLRLAEFQ